MTNNEDDREPMGVGWLELARGGGVLLRDPAIPVLSRLPSIRQRRVLRLPAELPFVEP